MFKACGSFFVKRMNSKGRLVPELLNTIQITRDEECVLYQTKKKKLTNDADYQTRRQKGRYHFTIFLVS